MPLKSGKSDKTRNENIGELMHAFKSKGKIGKTKPGSKAKAAQIAAAIAYKKQRES
jgi:hypothetical protein